MDTYVTLMSIKIKITLGIYNGGKHYVYGKTTVRLLVNKGNNKITEIRTI